MYKAVNSCHNSFVVGGRRKILVGALKAQINTEIQFTDCRCLHILASLIVEMLGFLIFEYFANYKIGPLLYQSCIELRL